MTNTGLVVDYLFILSLTYDFGEHNPLIKFHQFVLAQSEYCSPKLPQASAVLNQLKPFQEATTRNQ